MLYLGKKIYYTTTTSNLIFTDIAPTSTRALGGLMILRRPWLMSKNVS